MFHWFTGKKVSGKRWGGTELRAWLLGVTFAGTAAAQEEVWTADDPPEEAAQDEIAPETEGDITETIGGDEPSPSEGAATPAPEQAPQPAEPSSRIEFSGFARQSMELVFGEMNRATSPELSPLLWRDVFLSRTQLSLRSSYRRGRHFEATVSGVLGYNLHVAKDAPQYSVGTVDLTRGELSSDLREAYVGFYWPSVDVRIGQQRIAWGRSDFQSPNDVLNARDLRDPFLAETELRYLPTMALRSDFTLGKLTLQTVVSPVFTPDRYDVYGTTWSVLQRRGPEPYQRFIGVSSLSVDPTIEREFADLLRASELPPANGKGVAAGARLGAELSNADFAVYYHYGYDSTPYMQLSPGFAAHLATPDAFPTVADTTADMGGVAEALGPVLDLIDDGVRPYTARHVRRHHVGLDASTTLGPLVLRVDAAYETRRVFYTYDLTSYSTPAALGVFGIEYQTGNLDEVVLLEVLATRLLGDEPPILLGYERMTTALAGTLRWTLGEGWGVDLRGVVGLQPETYVLQPALRFKPSESFSLRLGALLVSGETASFGWYFADNDTAFLQLRYSF